MTDAANARPQPGTGAATAATITAPTAAPVNPPPVTAPASREIIREAVYQQLPPDRQVQLVEAADGWVDPNDEPVESKPDAVVTSARPQWVPESVWHPQTGFDQEAFIRYFDEEVEPILKAEQARKESLPSSPDDYKVATTPTFKLPPGDQVVLDANDPMWTQAKAWAIKHGLSKEGFQQAVDLVVAQDSITQAQVTRARNGELARLGPAAQARVNAIEAAYVDLLGETDAKAAMARIWTAADVVRHEKLVAKFAQAGRASSKPPGISDQAWNNMSPGERWEYSRSHDQSQFTGSRHGQGGEVR